MKKIRFYISLIIARLIALLLKLLAKAGTSFVGLFTLKYNPSFLKMCSKYVNSPKIAITGTNGKTTTSGLLAHIMKKNGKKIIHNEKGANMVTGIANVMALNILPFKKFDGCVLEIDEAYVTKLYDDMPTDFLLVTNLFKDQLDRYGELDTTFKKIQEAISKNKDLTLILNADDSELPLLAKDRKVIYFGFDSIKYKTDYHQSPAPSEPIYCECGKELEYSKKFYSKQGHYKCLCGYARPICDYVANATIFKDKIELDITHKDNIYKFTVNSIGVYNAYNSLGAITLALELGYTQDEIQSGINSFKVLTGRTQQINLEGHPTLIQLIKNPTGACEVLKTIDKSSNFLIAINDNFADGRDISWLWDTDFELLKDIKGFIVTSGLRAEDMALRLKYAGVPEKRIKLIKNLKNAIDYIVKNTDENKKITILPSYTALMEMKLK